VLISARAIVARTSVIIAPIVPVIIALIVALILATGLLLPVALVRECVSHGQSADRDGKCESDGNFSEIQSSEDRA